MGDRSDYAQGTPNWADLATSDVPGAKAFYGSLFGWEAEDIPEEQGGPYTMLRRDGQLVAGLARLPEGMPFPVWSTYIAVDDVDETITRAGAVGGSVVMPAMDVMGAARIAFIADPTGAAVGLWQAGSLFGAEVVNEVGALVWNELLTSDPATAEAFYSGVFGVAATTNDGPTGPYTVFSLGDRMTAGMMRRPEDMGDDVPDYWGVYFGVDDCDRACDLAEGAGGSVILRPMTIPGTGVIAVIRDPQGGVFSVIDAESYDP